MNMVGAPKNVHKSRSERVFCRIWRINASPTAANLMPA
jgi:hypothetical protein